MKIKNLIDEDFVNYKLPSMFLIFPYCSLKCDKENGTNYCYNSPLLQQETLTISKENIIERYLANPITEAIVCGGLEPFDSITELAALALSLRNKYHCLDKFVIFTGYTEEEIESGNFGDTKLTQEIKIGYWNTIKALENIVVKFGRFRPNNEKHFDHVLGVQLASDNQYAKEYNGID